MLIYPFRLWFFLASDVDKPIGGVKQIHRIAEAAAELGVTATIVQQSSDFRPSWFSSNVSTISLSDFRNLKLDLNSDLLVTPETTIASISSLFPDIQRIILNQNFAYTFGIGSSKILDPIQVRKYYESSLHVFSISRNDFSFLQNSFDLPDTRLTRLINPIESEIFSPPTKKFRQIAYMPRKNSKHSRIIVQLLQNHPLLQDWKFVPIAGLSQVEVASVLKDSAIFLSFGHPEGFGLPVAEALSCACLVIGYSGVGGKELFDIASKYSVAKVVDFGDWNQFFVSTLEAVTAFSSERSLLIPRLLSCSKEIRNQYTHSSLLASLADAFDKISTTLSVAG